MKIKTKESLDILEFIILVNSISAEYFNEHDEYTPHIGMLNAMRLFWNEYVEESDSELQHDIVEAEDLKPLVENEDFINAYNKAISYAGENKLDFANAYYNAMLIVENKKGSIDRLLDSVKSMIVDLFNKVAPMFTDENLDRIEKIGKDIASGKLSNQAIADAAINSGLIKNITN